MAKTQFTYHHDFDENGVLYYIGTGEGTGEPYANPAEAGRIAVTRSSEGTANDAAGRTDTQSSYEDLYESPGQWYKFDLGPERHAVPISKVVLAATGPVHVIDDLIHRELHRESIGGRHSADIVPRGR